MKRITGILNLDNAPVCLIDLDRMINAQKLNPIAGQGVWVKGDIGLGCNYTSSGYDGDRDFQLEQSPSKQAVITFDGRIDNRRELIAILNPQQVSKNAHISDEELVLAAFEKWELDCPKHLTGDFAFAIWDVVKQRLVCVRDHFGVKPFYYSLTKKSFVFSSAPFSLLASGKVPPVIREERIADMLTEFGGMGLEAIDKSSTFYKNVYRLPPAHFLILRAGQMTLERYWDLRPVFSPELKTEQDSVEAFRELFTEAVRCRLLDLPVPASMLSGGMDSSAIIGIGNKILLEEGKSILAFVVTSNSVRNNRETKHIRSVLSQVNPFSHIISVDELPHRMGELILAIEEETEPFDCWMNLNRAVYLHARDLEINFLLDGIDGDLLLSNSFCIPSLWQRGAFRDVINETLRADGFVREYKRGRRYFVESLYDAFMPSWIRYIHSYYHYRIRAPMLVTKAVNDTIISKELAFHSHLAERLYKLNSYYSLPPSSSQVLAHKMDLDHPNLPAGLERYERVASSFGVEARHPLTDVRLVEFCLGLPGQLKTQRGWSKRILRLAMESYLPTDVVWRRDKDSLMWEVNKLLLKEGVKYFHQATLDEKESLKPYVDTQKLEKIWQEYLTQGNEKDALLIWSGIALAFWLRRQRNMVRDLKLEQQ